MSPDRHLLPQAAVSRGTPHLCFLLPPHSIPAGMTEHHPGSVHSGDERFRPEMLHVKQHDAVIEEDPASPVPTSIDRLSQFVRIGSSDRAFHVKRRSVLAAPSTQARLLRVDESGEVSRGTPGRHLLRPSTNIGPRLPGRGWAERRMIHVPRGTSGPAVSCPSQLPGQHQA